MKKINKIITIMLMITLFSCTSKGNKKTQALYKANIERESIDDVTAKYGPYNGEWSDKKGNKVYQYVYQSARYNALVYVPIVAYFSSIMSENYEVILVYDKNNKFLAKKDFYNKVKSSTRLTCDGCIKKVYDDPPIQ